VVEEKRDWNKEPHRWPVEDGEVVIQCNAVKDGKTCGADVIKKWSKKNGTLILVEAESRLGHKFPENGSCIDPWPAMHEEQGAKRRAQVCQLSADLKRRIRDQDNKLHYMMELFELVAEHLGINKLPKPPLAGEEKRTPF